MTKVCGIELKASEAIISVINDTPAGITFIDLEPRKIRVGDHESSDSIRSFYSSFGNFVRDNHIDLVVIKQRALKGEFAGGAVSFKLEALIQLNEICVVELLSGQTIAANNKRDPISFPPMNKYQQQAYMTAVCHVRKNRK
jgi:rRNA maturation protein Rpf1